MANLDDFLRQQFPQANPEESPTSAADLRGAMVQVQQHDPDAYARAQRLALDKSIPVETVLHNLPQVEKQAEVERLDPSRLSPGLADWLKDPQNLAVARDDIGILDTLAGAYRAARGGMTEGFEQTELGSLAFKEWAGQATPDELSRIDQLERTMEARQREAEATGVVDSTGLTALREAGKMLPQMARTVVAGAAGGGAGAATGAGTALVLGQLGPQVATPEEAITVPAAAATGFGIGFRAGSAAESFQQETAFAFREFKKLTDETGRQMDPAVARTAAAGVGAINAGLEAFGLSLVLKTIPGGDKLLGKFTKDAVKQALKQRTVREALTQVAKRYGTAVSGEALTEMVQETVAILGREIAQASDDGTYAPDAVGQDVSRVFEAGKAALLGTAVISGAGATVQAAGEVQQARKAQETRETLNTLVGAAEQSKLRERLPEKFRAFLDKAQQGEPTENLYFNQSAFDAAAERMGVDGRSLYAGIVGNTTGYDEAVATGGNVVMPTAAYLEKVTGTRVHDEIAADAKFSPDDLSEREAAERGTEMKAVQDMADELKAAGDGMDPETRKVYDHFFGQLEGSNYDRAAAEDQAAIATAMVTRLAKRAGMTVDQILEKYGLDVRSTLPRVLREKPAEIDTQLYPLIDRLRAGDIPSERDVFGPTLLDFIRDRGGLKDEGGELSARDFGLWDKDNRKPGQRSIMGPQGRDLDDMAEQAVEAGYLFERDPNKLLDLIDREIGGSPVFSTAHSVDGKIAEMRDALLQLDEYLSREGVDLSKVDNAAVRALIETGNLPEAQAQQDAGTEFDQVDTQSPAFKAWFGDSKVVDADGKPLVVYHGTGRDTSAFTYKVGRDKSLGRYYFAADSRIADEYAGKGDGANTMPVYLSIQNPLEIDYAGGEWASFPLANLPQDVADLIPEKSILRGKGDSAWVSNAAIATAAESLGYDGLITRNVKDGAGPYGEQNAADVFLAFRPEQIKSVFNRGTFSPTDPNILNQTAGLPEPEVVLNQPAYHGSPYRFDKFSLEHLGKGEGAQAYGWGLYFASERDVARFYTPRNEAAEQAAQKEYEKAEKAGDYESLELWEEVLLHAPAKDIREASRFDHIPKAKREKVAKTVDGIFKRYPGSQLYRVEIPDDDQYLLWDKPVPEDVVRKIAEHSVERGLVDDADEAFDMLTDEFDVSGAKMYAGLSEQLGSDEAASKFLNEIGIAGIKYLDGTSRGQGDGSYNYVIFDDNAVQIAETYYQREGDRLGYIKIAPNRRLSITLLANANMSTFQHEMAHGYLEMLRDLVSQPGATPELQADWQTIREWLGVEGDTITVEQHEKFARGWEAYLMEGNAPSITLGRAFARMKSWMLRIYRKLQNLNVDLNDDVRGVFDRMIAAEDEIVVARKAQGYAAMFADAEQMGVSQREFEAYQRAVQDDLQAGVDRLQRDVMDELARERRQWWLEERAKVQAEVEAEVDADPGYGALSFIRRKGGTKLDRKALVDEFGEPFVKNLPRGLYAREGGAKPASIAALFEFESPAKLLEALVRADSMPRDQYVKAETDRRMKEAHGDMLNDGSLPERATYRIHNEKRADVLATELRALKRKQRETAGIVRAARQSDREMARAAMATVPETRVFREAARLAIAAKSLRGIRPYDYLLAERKASRESAAALAAGRWADAAKAKEQELVSHYMYLEAQKAKDEGEKILEHARRQMKAKRQQWLGKAGGDYLEQMNALLDTYEFRKVSGRDVRRRESLAQFAARKAAEGTPIDVPAEVLRRSGLVNYADVPLSELRGVMDSMQMIEHLAGLKNELLYNKDRRDFGKVRDEVVESIRDHNKTRLSGQFAEDSGIDAVRKHGRSVLSIVLQPGTLARGLDGGDRKGPLSRHVVDPVAEAETVFLNRRRTEGEKMAAILDTYTPAERKRMAKERLEVDGFPKGEGPTKWQAISLALNWGNEGNRQAILDSRDANGATLWDEGRVKAVLDTLDERDWKFVQDVWAYVNSFWPEIAEAQKRRTGITPKKVDGLPVATKFGVIQGAYYPLKYDARASWAVSADEAAGAFDAMRAGRTAHAYTPNGHTKERVGSGGRPVKLDIGVLGGHLDNVLRDIEMADAINSAWRVLHDREVVSALSASDNMDAITGFELWLQDTAVGEMVSGQSLMTGLRRIRTGFTAAVMLFNVANAALNLAGIGQSAVVVGKKHLARGAAQMLKGPLYGENNVVKQVMDLSPMMRIRLDTYNKDVADHLRSLDGRGDWREKLTQWGYVPAMATQIVVDTATWLGAYERAKAEGLEGDEAVQFADRLTEDAQSSGRFGQRTSLERGTVDRNVRQTELARVWTTLLSYMLNKANRAYERTAATDFKSPVEVASWVTDMAILYTVEAVLYAAVKGGLPDDDDEDDGEVDTLDWLAWAGKETGKSIIASLPFVRDGVSAAQGFSGGGVIGSFWDSVGKAYTQVSQGELDAAAVKAMNMLGGILFGYPAAQINKFITALSVEAEGKDVPAWQYVTGVPLKDR